MSAIKLRVVCGLVGALLVIACATVNIDLPAVTDATTGERLPGKIIWRDLLTHDPEGSQRFYAGLFGWEFESIGSASGFGSDSAYTLIRHNGKLIGGMIDTVALNGRDDISQWIVLMSVDDLDAAAAKFSELGGRTIVEAQDRPLGGEVAFIAGPSGAGIALQTWPLEKTN